MKTYEYRGFDKSGDSCRGLVEALSVKNAREKLAEDGILAEKLSMTGRNVRFSADQRAVTYRELSALLGAGLPLEKALDMLIKSPEMKETQIVLAGVRDRVREGASLAVAFTDLCETITSFETAIIEAAERSATVDVMLEKLADFIDEQEKLKSSILSAMLYPAVVVLMAVVIAVIMLVFFVPWANNILSEYNVQLPALTRAMLWLGEAVSKWGLPFAAVIAGAVFFFVRKLKDDSAFRSRWNRGMFKWPLIGRGYGMLVTLRFAKTMSILLGGGVSLIDSLILSGRATGSEWIAGLAEEEAESVRHGESLSDAIGKIPPLAGPLCGWIQTGEASGELEQLMDKAGKRCQEQWNRYTARCLTLIEPVLILLVACFVLLVVLSVLLPVINLSRMVGV